MARDRQVMTGDEGARETPAARDVAAPARIIRWVVPVDDEPHTFPLSGAIVHVASRSAETVTFWTIDTGPHKVDRTFQVVGTGHPFPSDWRHVGTALAADGVLVWHLMEHPA